MDEIQEGARGFGKDFIDKDKREGEVTDDISDCMDNTDVGVASEMDPISEVIAGYR